MTGEEQQNLSKPGSIIKNLLLIIVELKNWRYIKPLKHNLSGFWSRRINSEHRIVYKIENDSILIAQLRYHY